MHTDIGLNCPAPQSRYWKDPGLLLSPGGTQRSPRVLLPHHQQLGESLRAACLAQPSCAPALPQRAGTPRPRRTRRSGPGTAPCAGRYVTTRPGWGDTGTVPAPGRSLACSLRDKRPLHLLPLVPIPIPDGPSTRRPERRLASTEGLAPAESGETGRRPQPRRPGPAPFPIPAETGSAAWLLAPVRPGLRARPPASSALPRAGDREKLSPRIPGPRRPPHPRRAAPAASLGCRPGEPQGSGRPGPGLAQSSGGAGTGREPGAPSGPSPPPGHRARQPSVLELPGTRRPSRGGPARATYRGPRETVTERQRPDGGKARN